MIERAADDTKTLAIKMTLYRDGAESPHHPGPHPRGREREAGRRPRGAEGPLRRGEQHRLGEGARAGRRPRRLRRRRPEDARQDRPRRPPREGRDPPLRPPRHRQLQPDDGPHLHRLRPPDLPPRVRRGRDAALQHADGHRGEDGLPPARHGAEGHAPDDARLDRAGDGPRPRRTPRGHPGQDERARRLEGHRRALRGLAGGRRDRPRRPRDLLPEARRPGRLGADPGPLRRRPVPRAQPRLRLRERRRARRSSSRPPTGCRGTSSAASRSPSPSRTPSSRGA